LFAGVEICLQCSNYAVRERQASRFEELGAADLNGLISAIEIAAFKRTISPMRRPAQ
jgi:hypothetical protein